MPVIGNLAVAVTANTIGLKKGLSGATSIIGGFGSKIAGLAGALLPLGAAIGGVFGAQKAISAAREQIAAEKKLEAVLIATGGAAGLTAGEIGKLAGELQKTTDFGDEVTLSAAAVLATFKEIKGDTFKEALGAAQDLSAVMGQDLQSSVVQIGKALNDPIKGVTALQRVGVSFTQQQKDQIKALQQSGNLLGAQQIILKELQSEFGGAAAAMADPFTQAKNVLGDIAELVGFVLIPPMREVMRLFTGSVTPLTDNAQTFRALGESIANVVRFGIQPLLTHFQTISQGLHDIADFAIDSFLVMEFGWQHVGEIAMVAWDTMKLGALGFWEDLKHLFTAQIPAVLTWFADNWQSVFFTATDYALTVLINLGQNVRTIFANLMAAIAGEMEFGAILQGVETDLSQGFFNAISTLPAIPERVLTDTERQLAMQVDRMGGDLKDRLAEHLLTGRENLLGTGPAFGMPEVSLDIPESVAATAGRSADALDFGLSQAAKQALRLQAQGAGGESPEQKTVRELAQLKAQQKQQADAALAVAREQLAALKNVPRPLAII